MSFELNINRSGTIVKLKITGEKLVKYTRAATDAEILTYIFKEPICNAFLHSNRPYVLNIVRGSLLVTLYFNTAESVQQFFDYYESGELQKRLKEEFAKINVFDDNLPENVRNKLESFHIDDELTLEIVNEEEVKKVRSDLKRFQCTSLDVYDVLCIRPCMGYSTEMVKIFQHRSNPTDALLCEWRTRVGNDVLCLIEFLVGMERYDLVQLLKENCDKRGNDFQEEKANTTSTGGTDTSDNNMKGDETGQTSTDDRTSSTPSVHSRNEASRAREIRWRQVSKKHRSKLERLVELLQTTPSVISRKGIYSMCFRQEFCIGEGSDGTKVYVGLCDDGKEVAVKRLSVRMCKDLAMNEINILVSPSVRKEHHVVNYLFYDIDGVDGYVYVIMDLCEEDLYEYVSQRNVEELRKEGPKIFREILRGLEALHSGDPKILHRDLRPGNILVNSENEMILAYSGISRSIKKETKTLLSKPTDLHGWVAAESIPTDEGEEDEDLVYVEYKVESDIQVTGMLFFYILTGGKHPYGKSLHKRMQNIFEGSPVYLDKLDDPVAKDLIQWMLQHTAEDRPIARECLKHPYLLSKDEQFDLVTRVGNQAEIRINDPTSPVVQKLNADTSLPKRSWKSKIDADVMKHIGAHRSYSDDMAGLLRMIRNTVEHWHEKKHPEAIALKVGEPKEYFLKLFPTLPVVLHRIIRDDPRWKNRERLRRFFSQKEADTLSVPKGIGMRADAYDLLCKEINNGDIGRNWETIAKETKCSSQDIQGFQSQRNPFHAVLRNWITRSGEELKSILENMGRKDLTNLLDCTTEDEYLSAAENIEYNHAYNKALLEGETKDTRMQIMIIGHDRSGKTSLMKNLLGLKFDPEEPSTTGVETEVVEITDRNSRDAWPKKEKRLLTTSDELHDHALDVIAKAKKDNPVESVPTNGESIHLDKVARDSESPNVTRLDIATVTSKEYEGNWKSEGSKKDGGGEKSGEDKEENKDIGEKSAPSEFRNICESDVVRVKAKSENSRKEEKPVRLMLQDFAGQQLFYESHCCFLKSNCPIVLAYDARCNLEDIAKCSFKYEDGTEKKFDNPYSLTYQYSVSRWFQMLNHLKESESDDDSKKKFYKLRDKKTKKLQRFGLPPVLIALTHSNDVKKKQIEKIKKKIIEIGNDYENVFPQFFAIDNSSPDGDGVKDLRERLCCLCKVLLRKQKSVPLLWLKLEEKLQDYADRKAVSYEEVEKVAREVGIKNVKHPITFLHSRGVILFYSEDFPVVLNPPWVLDRFKKVITVPQVRESEDPAFRACLGRLRDDAILERKYLYKILGKKGKFLETVMERFGLICPWSCSSDKEYLVPSLAPLLPQEDDIDCLSDSPIASVFLRFVKTLPSKRTRAIHVPGVFGKLQTELIKKFLDNTSAHDDNITTGEAATSANDSKSNNVSFDPKKVNLRGNYTLVPIKYNGEEFEVFMTEIVENVKIGVFCDLDVKEETQRKFLSYLRSSLKYSLSRIKNNRIPLYRCLEYELAFKCPKCNVADKDCSEHHQKNCERASCLKFIKLENLTESTKSVSCEGGRHRPLLLKGVNVWLSRDSRENKRPADSNEDEVDAGRKRRKTTTKLKGQPKWSKIQDIKGEVYDELCKQLNKPNQDRDYKALAGNMGYSQDQVKDFALSISNPADALLDNWKTKSGNDLSRLIHHLKNIKRDDLVELLLEKC